jgi:acyl carrier protein
VARFTVEELREVLIDSAGVPSGLTIDDPSTPLADLDVDSVSLLALVVALEKRYGVRIRAADALRMNTVGDAVELVNGLLERADQV